MPSTNEPNNVWASNVPAGEAEELVMPSGQTCRAVKIGMEGLLAAGILTEADSLTALVSRHTRKVRGAKGAADGQEIDTASMIRNPDALKTILMTCDKAIPLIVESPTVLCHFKTLDDGTTEKIPVNKRAKPPTVYTDQIDLEDKMFLFTWALGSVGAMEPFRDEPTPDVGGVVSKSVNKVPAKRSPRGKK
jgi:hypothetical protein